MPLRAIFILLVLFLTACSGSSKDEPEQDLELGKKAYQLYEIGDAEMYFQRFLRKNPTHPRRWEIWNKLLNIALNIRQEKVTAAAYLEIMLEEFEKDDKRRQSIEVELAAISHFLRNENRAVELWEKLIEDQNLFPEEKAQVYRHLSRAYLGRLELSAAEQALQTCLELDVSPSTKSDCLYDMAESQVLTDKLTLAEINLQTLLAMKGYTEEREILSIFLLGDVLEQQQRYSEALEQFILIRQRFPNRHLIENRILYLEKRKTKKLQ